MKAEIIVTIRATLAAAGWAEPYPDVFSRQVQTAVGVKDITANLRATQNLVEFHYWSEGRNVVESCTFWLPADCAVDLAVERLTHALAHVKTLVDGSYARGLFLSRPEPETAEVA